MSGSIESIGQVNEVTESWAPIDGYDGVYSVSTRGRVRRNCDAEIPAHVKAGVMSPGRSSNGYLGISLRRNRRRRRHLVHRLVLEAFVGPCPDGMECRHLNGVRDDNRLENLQWSTHKVNVGDRRRHGTQAMGESHPLAKISETDALEIFRSSEPDPILAKHFGLSSEQVNGIKNGRSWRHVTGASPPKRDKRKKLCEADVVEILRSKEGVCATARRYGVSPSVITCIRKRRSWRHVTV